MLYKKQEETLKWIVKAVVKTRWQVASMLLLAVYDQQVDSDVDDDEKKLLKKYSYEIIYKRMVEDLIKLEGGILVNIPEPEMS